MKKLLGLILVIAMVLSMGLSATAEEGLKVAVVLSGATGDRSFYDSANEGLQALDRMVRIALETAIEE